MTSKRLPTLTAIALVASTGASGVMATPSIDSVSKSDTDSSKLIISGSGFTTKSHAAPLYYFDFENDRLSQSELSSVDDSVTVNGTITSETSPTGEGSVLRYRVVDDYRSIAIPRINFSSPPDQVYVYFHRRYNFSISDSSTWGPNGLNLKVNRLWGSDGNNIYIGYQGKEGNTSGRIYPEYTATGGSVWTGSKLPQAANQWFQEEIIYETSDIESENGRFDLVRDGNSVHNENFRMRTNERSSKYSELYFDQISNGVNDSNDLYIYYDNIYIDDSHHRVYVSESPTLSDAKRRLIQVPVQWSDNRIEISFNTGDISPNNAYIYVVDGAGNANSQGASICEIDCPVAPNPPESITVE